MFTDSVNIVVKAGNGGDGSISFRREKYVANGGPDGGDGGNGGSVFLKVDKNLTTLLDFRYKSRFLAPDGKNGSGARCSGKKGQDLYITVPQGTIVKNVDKDIVIADLVNDKDTFLLAKGGRGGRGNQHFKSSTRQVPRFAEMGEKTKIKNISLELKMLADVGLIGYPNVGKSTIISKISKARPKIGDYHFTTTTPILGVVLPKNLEPFVVADIPGLIEGASQGAGLGHTFLKHIERTRLLLHVIDVSSKEGRDPVEDLITINNELVRYSKKLSKKMQIIVANKIDSISDIKVLEELEKYCKENNLEFFKVSAISGKGLDELVDNVANRLKNIDKENIVDIQVEEDVEQEEGFEITKEDDKFIVKGPTIERIMRRINVFDDESIKYLQKLLKEIGVMEQLFKLGLKPKDIVVIEDYIMEYDN